MQILKTALEVVFVYFLKLIFIFHSKENKATLLSAPIPETNMGDQALVLGALEGMKIAGFNEVLLFKNSSIESPKAASEQYLANNKYQQFKLRYIEDLYLAFVTPLAFRERLRFYFLVANSKYFFVIGADIMDGTYGGQGSMIRNHLFTYLDRLGVKPVVLGFSLSEKVTNEARTFMEACSTIACFNARDRFSFERLQKYVKKPNLVADVAFLMKPTVHRPLDSIFSSEAKQSNRLAIGLCIKDSDLGNEQANLESYSKLCTNIIAQADADIYLIPHHPADLATLNVLAESLVGQELEGRVFKSDALLSAADVKMIVAQLDFVITARMHVAIASLGSGVPVLCITYGNKFEGLMHHFELPVEEHVISEVSNDNFDEVYEKIITAISKKEQLAESISKQKPNIKKLALMNIPS